MRHARFLGLRFVRRWPKAPPRGTLGEYAVSPRSDLRSPASLPAATRRDPAFTKQPSPQPFLQPSNNHSNYNPTTTQPSFVSNPRTISTQPSHIRDSPNPTTSSCMALARPSTVLSKSGRFALASQSHDMVQYVPAMAKAKVTGRRRGLR